MERLAKQAGGRCQRKAWRLKTRVALQNRRRHAESPCSTSAAVPSMTPSTYYGGTEEVKSPQRNALGKRTVASACALKPEHLCDGVHDERWKPSPDWDTPRAVYETPSATRWRRCCCHCALTEQSTPAAEIRSLPGWQISRSCVKAARV